MNTTVNSINQNGCSVCRAGEEKYTTFRPAHRPNSVFYQYDYRHTNNSGLFSTVAPTLEQCRNKRDRWLQRKNYERLSTGIIHKINTGKRLTKSEMAHQIGHIQPLNTVAISWNFFTRDEIVSTFNKMFGTAIE
jgi:hypothetical protein